MAIIWQRGSRTPGPGPAWPKVPDVLSAVTAAAAPIPPEQWGKATKTTPAESWQAEAWKYLDQVGELSFAMLWKQSLLSRFRLVASDIDPETGKPTGSTENRQAQEIVSRIAGGTTGQSQMMSRLSPLLTVPGEGWLAIVYPDGVETWLILSRDEVKAKGENVELLMPDGTRYQMDKTVDTLQRIWRPDPKISSLAWSPVKAALPILRRMVRMEQTIEAAGKSRIAGNGILLLPTEISLPSQSAPTGEVDPDAPNLPPQPAPVPVYATAGQIRQALQDAMAKAIEDQSSAAAMVPIILQAKADFLKEIRHLRLDSEVSDKAQAALEAATRRLAMTLDMPAEVLLGMADLNHWSLWGVENEAVRWHASPEMEVICDALTRTLLRPMLPGTDNVVIWYDTADVESAPDDTEKVRTGYTDGVVNSDAYLKAIGLGDGAGYDLTTKEGLTMWAADQIRRDATLIPVLAPLLKNLIPDLAATPAPAVTPSTPAALPAAEVVDAQGPPDTQPGVTAAAVERLCVREALRLAGNRRRTRAVHGQLRDVPVCDTHRHLPPVASTEVPRLIEGWEEIADPEVLALAGLSLADLQTRVTRLAAAELAEATS